MTELHDVAVTKGTMQQLFFWLGFLEIFSFIAIAQMMRGEIDRMPGDYYFDPLNCTKNPSVRSHYPHLRFTANLAVL